MASRKPEIPNVFWRNGWAWGRIQRRGQDIREPLDTQDPKVARQRVQAWIDKLKGQDWGEKPQRSFDEAADKFIEEHLPRLKGGVAGKAAKRYLLSMTQLAPHFSGLQLETIGSGVLSTFEQKRRKDGVATGTIRNDLWCLSSIFTRAEEWEWVKGNPVAAYIRARAKRGLLPAAAPRTRYCSHDEETELIRRCQGKRGNRYGGPKEDHLMLAAGIALTCDIGLRAEELLGADWSMVNLDKNEWTVPKELAKSGRARVIPILPRSQMILRSLPRSTQIKSVLWHDDRGLHRRYVSLLPMLQDIASGGRTYILRREMTKLSQSGLKKGPITVAQRARWQEIAEADAWADPIPDIIWHDLRRTCGCRLLQDHGLSMEQVSKWLGHASVQQTEKVYAFLEVKHLHRAVGTGPNGVENRHTKLIGPGATTTAPGTKPDSRGSVEDRTT